MSKEIAIEGYEKHSNKCSIRADVFSHYFFIFQCIRGNSDVRYLRNRIVELFNEDKELRERYREEVTNTIARGVEALGYINSVIRYRKLCI